MSPVQTIETESTKSWSFTDWYWKNQKLLGIAGAVVLVAAAGAWFYMRSAQIKQANAERGLSQAKQSLGAGNVPLAMTDLQRVAERYKSTPAGVQAAMVLAQLDYEQGKYADGLKALEGVRGSARAAEGDVLSLIGDGQLAGGKPDDAAASYRKAAEATRGPAEKALHLAKAARALMVAGKDAEAKAIWQQLADDPDAAALRNEAEVRLGELTVEPAGKS